MSRARLQWIDRERRLREFRLVAGEPVRVGRHPSCDVVLEEASVSRHHLLLSLIGDTWFAENLSSHGTVVEAERLSGRRALSSGDRLRLGGAVVRFKEEDEVPVNITVPLGARRAALTAKEREVLVALARPVAARRGPPLSNEEIAAELVLSLDGVRSHLRSIYAKFDLTDGTPAQRRAALVQRALDEGYVWAAVDA